jgi:hypothetical protein
LEAVLWILTRERPNAVSYDKNPHFYEDLDRGASGALDKGAAIDPCRFDKKLSDFAHDHPVLHILLDCKWRIFADCLSPSRMLRGFWTCRSQTVVVKGQICQPWRLQVACANGLTDHSGVLNAVHAFGIDIKTDLRLIGMKSDECLQNGTWVNLVKHAIQLGGQHGDLSIQVVPLVQPILHCNIL